MEFFKNLSNKCRSAVETRRVQIEDGADPADLTPWQKVKRVIGIIARVCYHSRKVILTIPVAYYALKLAAYNTANLPETVGVILQSDGSFLMELNRSLAVLGPLGLTAGCLFMMFLARKAMYAWAISVFSLLLPILLLFSNLYPA